MRALIVAGLLAVASPAQADDAWDAYDAAFLSLAAGDRAGARAQLETVTTTWPDHPAAARATARLGELGVGEVEVEKPPTAPLATSRVARGELILGMTVSGVMIGVEACTDGCDDARSMAAATMLGGGAALTATTLLTRDGVQRGQAQLYTSAAAWGRWNALGINDGFSETTREAWVSIGAQAAGLGAGLGLWRLWHPASGDVALANSGLLWGTVLTMFGSIWVDHEPTMATAVVAGDLGLLLGAALGAEVEMSRGRTLLIDTGGLLGAIFGGLISLGIDDDGSPNKIGGVLTLSTAAGLVLAAVATRNWDDPPPTVPPSVQGD